MENENLKTALRHQEQGRSVFPVRPDKKPFVKWERYQTEKPSLEQVKEWWGDKFKGANIGIVTGAISNLTVVDPDSQKGIDAVNELIPDSLLTPIARTPGGGQHLYFEHQEGVGCATRFLPDTDLRSDGGYIIAPPSVGQNGKPYAWMDGLSIFEVVPCPLPKPLYNKINLFSNIYKGGCPPELQDHNKALQTVTNRYMNFNEGQRDESLFHLANCLFKGGMAIDDIQQFLSLIAAKVCNPPFPQREVDTKIKSAIKRCQTRKGNLAKDIQDWLSVTDHYISVTECDEALQIVTSEQKSNRRVIFHRLVKDGILERDPKRPGAFRKIEDASPIDFLNASDTPFDIKWPFGLEEYALIHPKNIIVIAGVQNAGKTALVLNVARLNMARHRGRIRYVSSEMGGSELKGRLQKFDIPLKDWKAVDFREKSSNFADIIMPDGLNIIDFYEISDKFWLIADDLKRIYDKLNKGIAIVCLQKSAGKSEGRGGDFGLEKPRLYLNLDPDPPDGAVLTIRKAKAWAREGRNPNWYKTRFKIVNGSRLIQQGDWFLETR